MIRAIGNLTSSIRRQISRSNRYRETMRELGNLTNRELSDIGITRWDIPRLAREHAERNHA